MELAFATLFVIPATFKLGFVLGSCYFGRAIATELSHNALKVNPFIPIVCCGSARSSGTDRYFTERSRCKLVFDRRHRDASAREPMIVQEASLST